MRMYQLLIIKGVTKTKTWFGWIEMYKACSGKSQVSVVSADRTAHSITLAKKSNLKAQVGYHVCKECSFHNTMVANDLLP